MNATENTGNGRIGAYSDEVLDAGWLPRQHATDPAAPTRETRRPPPTTQPEDPDSFLRRLYLAQE
ncbi:MAG: hypothetical protein REI09_01585 [Candidatus Dactylopiibacterium sp.]|nr:hypothetical protein [Candidatus Dactylopiibacterium sp.]